MNDLNGQVHKLTSPDGKLELRVFITDTVKWSLYSGNIPLLEPSAVYMKLSTGVNPGLNPVLKNKKERTINEIITPAVPVKNRDIINNYNELVLEFESNYKIAFRAYDDGAAYRFETSFDSPLQVIEEYAGLNFGPGTDGYFPIENSEDFISHYERSYKDTLLSALTSEHYCSLPLLVNTQGNRILITEADLYDYPNMFLRGTAHASLDADFPEAILVSKYVSDRDEEKIKTAGYIASTSGSRTYPWRTFIVATDDKVLLESEMVYKLSSPPASKNTGWIIPGRVAWDWWNTLNIYDVNFKSGINTETYKYYIDFASRFGLEYIILDEGWSRTTHDLLHTVEDLDLRELIGYGKEKNVGIILWVLWNPLNENLESILDSFSSWGIKGIKVDFMQRADQDMVNFYERCALEAAKRHLLVDFHGAFKPAGLHRKYPNVLSFEGLKGLEHSKWSYDVSPEHDVTLPFIRMAAGPMDYTPGAMVNAIKSNFRPVFSEPMSQGTRCHQAAMYVVYTSPLQMFSDNPSNYLKDTLYTGFVSRIPSFWDKTIGLDSRVSDYAAVARKNGNTWYIGVMTDWEPREIEISLSFLDKGEYILEFLRDGINADKHAADYYKGTATVTSNDKLKISLAPGGGWLGILNYKKSPH